MSDQKKKSSRKHLRSVTSRLRGWFENKSPVLQFGLKFALLLVLFYGLLATTFFDRLLYSYLIANAWLANAILQLMGQPTHVSDVIIQSPKFSMAIRRGCDAVEPTWLLCAAILSFPATTIHKLWGMLWGIILLQALNLLRIVTLYWIGIHLPSFFNSAHVEIWPTIFIICAITLFVSWKGRSSERVETNVPA